MKSIVVKSIVVLLSMAGLAIAAVPFNVSGPVPDSIGISSTADSVLVTWKDKAGRPCSAQFSLDPAKPLIAAWNAIFGYGDASQ